MFFRRMPNVYSPPKACFYLRSPALNWLSQYYKYTVAKQNGGEAEWAELIYSANQEDGRTNVWSLVVSRRVLVDQFVRLVQYILYQRFFAGYSGLYCSDSLAVSILCASHGQWGFKWEGASLSNSIPNLATVVLR